MSKGNSDVFFKSVVQDASRITINNVKSNYPNTTSYIDNPKWESLQAKCIKLHSQIMEKKRMMCMDKSFIITTATLPKKISIIILSYTVTINNDHRGTQKC